MYQAVVTLYHGTTLQSARAIVGSGVRKRLHVTTNLQLAADYARFRAVEELANAAMIEFSMPIVVFHQWLAGDLARERDDLLPMSCYVLYAPIWQYLQNIPTTIWSIGVQGATVTYAAA